MIPFLIKLKYTTTGLVKIVSTSYNVTSHHLLNIFLDLSKRQTLWEKEITLEKKADIWKDRATKANIKNAKSFLADGRKLW